MFEPLDLTHWTEYFLSVAAAAAVLIDVVDGAVEIVDPPLERDGEVDQVGLAAAEKHLLRGAHPAHPEQAPDHQRERGERNAGGPDRDPRRGRARQAHGELRVKMTGYS